MIRTAYFFTLGALVGAACAIHACANLDRALAQFFNVGDSALYAVEDAA